MSNPKFNLKKYLHDLYLLEKQKYILEERDHQLSSQKREKEYNNYRNYISPDFRTSNYYRNWLRDCRKCRDYEPRPNDLQEHTGGTGVLVIVFGVIGFFAGAFTGCSMTFDGNHSGNVVWPIFVFTILGLVLGGVIGGISNAYYEHEYKKRVKALEETNRMIEEDNKKNEAYNRQRYQYWLDKFCEEERGKIENDKEQEEKYNKTKALQIAYIDKEKTIVKKDLQEIEKAINLLYELNINGDYCIHPAYRGLSTVAVLYGYIDTGRCLKLEGHEGAYNLYENEKRLGEINDKLDSISDRLDELNGAMRFVGQAIYSCDQKLDVLNENSLKIIDSIEFMSDNVYTQTEIINDNIKNMNVNISGMANDISSIEVSSKNIEYYSDVASQAASFTAYYKLING